MKTDSNMKKTPGQTVVEKNPASHGFGGFLKKLNQPVGHKKKADDDRVVEKGGETRQLWGRDFDIVERGLDESQVVSFVNELLAKGGTANIANNVDQHAAAEVPAINGTSFPQVVEETSDIEGLQPLHHGIQLLSSGEVEIKIKPPVNPKMVVKIFNHFQNIPEIKVLYTTGSWEQSAILTVILEQPMPLLSLIADIEGIKGSYGISEEDGIIETNRKVLQARKKARVTRINLLLTKE